MVILSRSASVFVSSGACVAIDQTGSRAPRHLTQHHRHHHHHSYHRHHPRTYLIYEIFSPPMQFLAQLVIFIKNILAKTNSEPIPVQFGTFLSQLRILLDIILHIPLSVTLQYQHNQ